MKRIRSGKYWSILFQVLVLVPAIACRHKPATIPEKMIVNTTVSKTENRFVVKCMFANPIYMDMDGHLIEHGILPVKVKKALFNNIEMKLSNIDTLNDPAYTAEFTDSLLQSVSYKIVVKNLNDQSFEGEIKINEKSYLSMIDKLKN